MNVKSLCLACTALFAVSVTQAQEQTGFIHLSVPQKERGQDLTVSLYYPADAGGTALSLGENPLFVGVPVASDAPAHTGRYPLVLLSHGSGGNAENLAWIATKLVQAGYIVAAPNHPGTTSGDSTPAATLQMWHRPQDLSAVLDAMLSN